VRGLFFYGMFFAALLDYTNIMDASDLILLIQLIAVSISGWITTL
jgi:hypothetical protein